MGTPSTLPLPLPLSLSPNTEPSPNGDDVRTSKKANEYTSHFLEFWAVYPRSAGKYQAAVAYAKAEKLAGHEALMTAVRLFAPYGKTLVDRNGKSVCPHATTWLNGRRYEDDPETWQDRNGNGHAEPETANLTDAERRRRYGYK